MAISRKGLAYAILLLYLSAVVFCGEDSKKKSRKTKDDGDEATEGSGTPSEETGEATPAGDTGEATPATEMGEATPASGTPSGGAEESAPAGGAPVTEVGPAEAGSIPASSGGNAKVFNVLDFGVKPGPNTDNAVNFVKAWRAACDSGGRAKLLFPKGEFHASAAVFQGPCKAPIDVEIQGTILAASDLSSYTDDFWMSFEKVNGLNVMGTGTVDGQGPNVWKYKEKGGSMFPISLKFIGGKQITMTGITSVNPMGFHISIVECDDVLATNMHLIAPDDSPNTDGFHISQSTNVRVLNSVVGTGDDCVGVIHGSANVVIRGVVCGPGHGLSIGSLGKYDDEKLLENVLIENCTMKNTDNGCRIKTYAGSLPSVARNITYKDIIVTNVSNPIIIDQSYGKKSTAPSKVQISNAQFINIKGTTPTDAGVDLQCSKAVPCLGIRLANIDLQYIGTKPKPFVSNCTNVKVAYEGTQSPKACA